MFTGPRKSREQEVRNSRPGHAALFAPPIHGPSQPAVVPDDPRTRHARAKTELPPPAAARSVGDLVQRYSKEGRRRRAGLGDGPNASTVRAVWRPLEWKIWTL
jgi:hypothetical protein